MATQKQVILQASDHYTEMDLYFRENNVKTIFLVCDASIVFLKLNDYFSELSTRLGIEVIRFSEFRPNPLYESVVHGVDLFRKSRADIIVAVGGGSAIDVAKCIKLYAHTDDVSRIYLEQKIIPNSIKLVAVPTTAGTGSEATRYAVIYYQGEKQSVTDRSCIPSAVLLDPDVLSTLPLYQKKTTMMDALCHSIESFWSVNSTEASKRFATKAISMILKSWDSYLNSDYSKNKDMLMAAYYAGQAINITQTTAGHALSYKLSSLYGISHGHAVALCIAHIWPYMLAHTDQCVDPRGKVYLEQTFHEIAAMMGVDNAQDAVKEYLKILAKLNLSTPRIRDYRDYTILKNSVNVVRLKNNPVKLDVSDINIIYHQILEEPTAI